MDLLKRVGELNRDHWLVDTFGARLGVSLWLLLRSFNPFAWNTIGADSLIFLLWLVPAAWLGRGAGIPALQGDDTPFWWITVFAFVLGLVGFYSELRFMDQHGGRPRSMLRGMDDTPAK